MTTGEEIMADQKNDYDEEKELKPAQYVLGGACCGFCCGGIGAAPMLRFNETSRRQKSYIIGMIVGAIISAILSIVLLVQQLNRLGTSSPYYFSKKAE